MVKCFDIFDLQMPVALECEKKGLIFNDSLIPSFWYWVSWSCPDVSCPNCGSYKRHQDQDALDHGYSILVCRDCSHREFDD